MKHGLALFTLFAFLIQSCPALAVPPPVSGPDTRIYLTDGTLIEGHLVEKTDELIVVRVKEKIYTFDLTDVDKIVTIDSLGGEARTITVTEFPYISFLGGAVAFGLLSWLQFDRASDKDKDADLNRESGLITRAKKLDDQADRARLLGWSSALLAVGCIGVALIPRKATRRVFPELSLRQGNPQVRVSYVYYF